MSANLPSLRGLAALAALARHGRHGAAAEALGISRSALSHRLADLQAELGATLITPQGRLSALSDEGVALLAAMGDALEKIETAVAPLQRRRNQVRLSTVNTFASNWLLPRLPEFQQRNPGIEIAVFSTQRVVNMEEEDVDCAIRHGLGDWPAQGTQLLFHETLTPAAVPELATISPSDWRIIRARTRYRDWARWWDAAAMEEDPPQGGVIVENRAQALEAALAGAGVVLTDANYLKSHLASRRLVQLGAIIGLAEGYYLVRRSNPRNPRHVDCLQRWLLEQVSLPASSKANA
jgi:DNA-binding transcriptional LysR family regulator